MLIYIVIALVVVSSVRVHQRWVLVHPAQPARSGGNSGMVAEAWEGKWCIIVMRGYNRTFDAHRSS